DRAPPMRGQREGAPRGAPSRCREMTVVTTVRRTTWLFEVVLELAAPRRMTQLAQCLRLDLTDALACDVELAPDLFEGARAAVLETEAQLEHAALAERQPLEHALHLLLEQFVRRRVGWGEGSPDGSTTSRTSRICNPCGNRTSRRRG